jgi:hypothetical protein
MPTQPCHPLRFGAALAVALAAQAAVADSAPQPTPVAAPVAAPVATAALAQAVAVRPASAPTPTWTVDADDRTLKNAMQRWARDAGWQLVWELKVDYPLNAHGEFSGTFEEAVEGVARSLERTDTPMKAIFYRGNHVLRVVAKGAQ